jgi:AraC family transcriptional regulator
MKCTDARYRLLRLCRFAVLDPLLEQLAMAIVTALQDGSVRDGLYIDTLAQMIAVHLARQHSARSLPDRTPTARPMSNPKMRRIVDFIEENLGRDLSLEVIAAEAEISPLYLPRACVRWRGISSCPSFQLLPPSLDASRR